MAEEEVSYASVVFKKKNSPESKAKKEEETVYDQVKVDNDGPTTELVPDNKADSSCCGYQRLACCLGILCVILLLGVTAFLIYIVKVHPEETLKAVNQTVTNIIKNLTTVNENLKMENKNLTQNYTVLDNKVTNLTAQIQSLQTEKKQLESDKENLTTQVKNLETGGMELNISRAQWTVDQYCKIKDAGLKCNSCQSGWILSGSCYVVNNAEPADQKTWEEARAECREKISDLVVVLNQTEKTFVTEISWPINSVHVGYWLGLRVEDGKWKWVDGRDLTDVSWIQQQPATVGQCAISVQNEGWKSVSCTEKKAWICKKKALTL